ncbi:MULTISPECIES: AAA family ATPase [Paenarthrobacter]|uniref:AAA family ATPase n=1 Tax=Paenarthrobacter TaxID=1742992 RepID=UPI0013E335A0|nr:AAA family ATPase [Paenarthrobacter ureafaciens]
MAIEQAEFPSRIIAASAAANDKFPNARRYPLPDDYYYYFGLRDATGRASGIAPLLSALQALSAAEAGDARRINAVATVFRLLGYREVLTHRYGWRYLRHLRQGESPSSLYVQGSLGPDARHRIEGLLRHDPDVLEKLDAAVASAKITSSKSLFWEIEADFSKENIGAKSNASREFSDSNLLRRAGLIRLESVILKRLGDGALLDLREASSGQISLATTFLGIAASITDGALVLIDEPEISLHPEWQAAYLGLAQRLFSSYTGCHFLVATHSPSVVAGMSETNANAVSLDLASVGPEVSSNYGGDSVDELLVREFGVYESGNLFLQKELARALDLASVGEISSDAFRHAVEVISPAAIELKDEPFGRLVASLLRAAKHADDSEVGSVSR